LLTSVEKVGGLQSQGVKVEIVVGYIDPLTTQDLKSSGLSVSSEREVIMKKTILAFILALLLSLSLGLFIVQASAETANWKVTSYVVKMEGVPVPDVEGHFIGMHERRGLAIFEDGEVRAYHTRGTFDIIKGQGSFQGYTTLTSKDGAETMVKYQGNMTLPPGEKLPIFSGKGEYIKGTGRFQGIKGEISFKGKNITPFGKETKGDVAIDATGTYTLPSQ
jgi:hypothetical protein